MQMNAIEQYFVVLFIMLHKVKKVVIFFLNAKVKHNFSFNFEHVLSFPVPVL